MAAVVQKTFAPSDPNVYVPPAVKRAAEAAEAAQKAHIEALNAKPPQETNAQPQPESITTNLTQEVSSESSGGQGSTQPVSADNESTFAQPEGQGGQAPPDDTESWRHKYDSLKGRYEKQTSQIQALTEQVGSMQAALQEAARHRDALMATQAPREPPKRLLTPEEENDYGEGFLDVVGRRAQEVLAPVLANLHSQIQGTSIQARTVQEQIQLQRHLNMMDNLKSRIQNFDAINNDPNFHAWLAMREPYSGALRKDALKNAVDRLETDRVERIFKDFLREEAALNPASSTPAPRAAQAAPKLALDALAAPGRARSAATTVPAEKPFYTRKDLDRFYKDVATGKYAGRDDERKQIDRSLMEAAAEGRVYP